jgi:hypothetical protein
VCSRQRSRIVSPRVRAMLGGPEYLASLQTLSSRHEKSLLSQAAVLSQRATQKKSDAKDCEELVKSVNKITSKWRRTTSLSVELFTEVSIERSDLRADMHNIRDRIQLNEQLLQKARKENESIQRLIAELQALQ